jgi:hypothetical protein
MLSRYRIIASAARVLRHDALFTDASATTLRSRGGLICSPQCGQCSGSRRLWKSSTNPEPRMPVGTGSWPRWDRFAESHAGRVVHPPSSR